MARMGTAPDDARRRRVGLALIALALLLFVAEMVAISECLEQLTPQQWDAPSLCDGWRVRDVVSHMCVGYTTRMPVMLAKVARRGFNVPRASLVESIAFGSSHSGKEIAAIFKEIHTKNIRRGISWKGEGPTSTD